MTDIDLDAIEQRANAAEAAIERMTELGGGVGLLGEKHPEMFEDWLKWAHSSENDHADTALALIAEYRRLAALVEAQAAVIDAAPHAEDCQRGDFLGRSLGLPCTCWKAKAPHVVLAERDARVLREAADDIAARANGHELIEAADKWAGYYSGVRAAMQNEEAALNLRADHIEQEARNG